MMNGIDPNQITCKVCGIRHDGGPTGFGPCPNGHTIVDEVKKPTQSTTNNNKHRNKARGW